MYNLQYRATVYVATASPDAANSRRAMCYVDACEEGGKGIPTRLAGKRVSLRSAFHSEVPSSVHRVPAVSSTRRLRSIGS